MARFQRFGPVLSTTALALVLLLATEPTVAADRPKVVATTVQITALDEPVAGDLVDLKGIIPAGLDPHEFEPVGERPRRDRGRHARSCGTGSGSTTGWTGR